MLTGALYDKEFQTLAAYVTSASKQGFQRRQPVQHQYSSQ